MDFKEWSSLSSEEQQHRCQSLNPYEEWPLFKSVEAEFMRQHGNQPGVAAAFCGLASGVGPLNAITVSIKRGKGRTRFPGRFMGFPVLRLYSLSGQPGAQADGPAFGGPAA